MWKQNVKYKIFDVEYKILNVKYKIQNTKYKDSARCETQLSGAEKVWSE